MQWQINTTDSKPVQQRHRCFAYNETSEYLRNFNYFLDVGVWDFLLTRIILDCRWVSIIIVLPIACARCTPCANNHAIICLQYQNTIEKTKWRIWFFWRVSVALDSIKGLTTEVAFLNSSIRGTVITTLHDRSEQAKEDIHRNVEIVRVVVGKVYFAWHCCLLEHFSIYLVRVEFIFNPFLLKWALKLLLKREYLFKNAKSVSRANELIRENLDWQMQS
jgi:hypothetical protein